MDRLWDWLKHADAKTLFLASIALFVAVLMLVAWQHFGCAPGTTATTARSALWKGGLPPPDGGTSNLTAFVARQLSAEALTVPVDPFRPDVSDLAVRSTNVVSRHRHGNNMASMLDNSHEAATAVVPRLTYYGYFQRPDGTHAAFFGDSVDKTSRFLTPGATIRDVTLVSADIRSASIRMPNGETTNLPIGASVTLQ